MDNLTDKYLSPEYLALKAANDELREKGMLWLWNTLDKVCEDINRHLTERLRLAPLQTGRQDCEFKVNSSTMVGERYGVRHRTNTLIIEAGWPRLAEHGFVPDGGLARGRIGLSRNVMLEPQVVTELIYRRQGDTDPIWYTIKNKGLIEQVNESTLHNYVTMILEDIYTA